MLKNWCRKYSGTVSAFSGGSLLLAIFLAVTPGLPTQGNVLVSILIVLFGFFFATVSSRITGLIVAAAAVQAVGTGATDDRVNATGTLEGVRVAFLPRHGRHHLVIIKDIPPDDLQVAVLNVDRVRIACKCHHGVSLFEGLVNE